jgi:hypothetical protein
MWSRWLRCQFQVKFSRSILGVLHPDIVEAFDANVVQCEGTTRSAASISCSSAQSAIVAQDLSFDAFLFFQ